MITSDHALKLESVPDWIAIVGSGYIGLEFSDVYTALGSEVYLLCITLFFLHYYPYFQIAGLGVFIGPKKSMYNAILHFTSYKYKGWQLFSLLIVQVV